MKCLSGLKRVLVILLLSLAASFTCFGETTYTVTESQLQKIERIADELTNNEMKLRSYETELQKLQMLNTQLQKDYESSQQKLEETQKVLNSRTVFTCFAIIGCSALSAWAGYKIGRYYNK